MPFCAGATTADEKGINCFNAAFMPDRQLPAGCVRKKHVYILNLCLLCLKLHQKAGDSPRLLRIS